MTAIHAKNKAAVEGNLMDKCHELQAKFDAAEAERGQLVQQLDAVREQVEVDKTKLSSSRTTGGASSSEDKETQVRPDELQKSMMHHADNNERRLTQPGFTGSKGHKSFIGMYVLSV